MKFSVIIPVYNVAPYLLACLESVQAAVSGREVEVLCIDDGSTDGSGDLLDAFVRHHPAFSCVHQPNAGVSAARNAGLERARGDWILFVDSDDVVRESWLHDVDRAVTQCPSAELVAFSLTIFEGKPRWREDRFAVQEIDLGRQIPDRLSGTPFWSMAYRRSVIASLRFRPFAFGEDLIFACEAMACARHFVYLLREEYGYRRRSDSATQAEWTTKRMIDTISFCPVMFDVLAQSGKRIGQRFVRGRGDEWLFRIPLMLHWLGKRVDGPYVWETWFKSVEGVRRLSIMDTSQRWVSAVAALRCRWLVLLACRIALKVRHYQKRRSDAR